MHGWHQHRLRAYSIEHCLQRARHRDRVPQRYQRVEERGRRARAGHHIQRHSPQAKKCELRWLVQPTDTLTVIGQGTVALYELSGLPQVGRITWNSVSP